MGKTDTVYKNLASILAHWIKIHYAFNNSLCKLITTKKVKIFSPGFHHKTSRKLNYLMLKISLFLYSPIKQILKKESILCIVALAGIVLFQVHSSFTFLLPDSTMNLNCPLACMDIICLYTTVNDFFTAKLNSKVSVCFLLNSSVIWEFGRVEQ